MNLHYEFSKSSTEQIGGGEIFAKDQIDLANTHPHPLRPLSVTSVQRRICSVVAPPDRGIRRAIVTRQPRLPTGPTNLTQLNILILLFLLPQLYILKLLFIVNNVGSIGDIYNAFKLSTYPNHTESRNITTEDDFKTLVRRP